MLTGAELPPGVRAAALDLCSAAYGEDYAPYMRAFPQPVHVLGWLEGGLVSHALWVERWLQPAGLPALRTAYVEAVASAPAYRRRGFASAVMQRLAAEIRDYELGALSPAELGLYERAGWQLWRGPLAIRTPDGLLATPGERVMVLRLPRSPALDLAAPLSAEWRAGELW